MEIFVDRMQFASSELFKGQDLKNHPNNLSVTLDFERIEMGGGGTRRNTIKVVMYSPSSY